MKLDSQSLYRDIIKRAFWITWHNRFLWIFGFFITFLGLGGMYNFVLKNSWDNTIFNRLLNKITSVSLSGIVITENLDKINLGNLFLLFAAMLLVAVAIAFFVWLAINSFGGLIHSSQILDKKKKGSFVKSFNKARNYFWPILGVTIMGKALILIFLTITSGLLSSLVVYHSVGRALLYFFSSLILVSISLLISFLIIYASCFIVLKSKGVLESLHKAWTLFKENWVLSVEAAVILFFINLLVKIALIIVVILVSIPFMILLLLFYSASLVVMPTFIIALWIFISIILMILIGSFFSAFQIVAWTFIFDKISKGRLLSKLYRIFS